MKTKTKTMASLAVLAIAAVTMSQPTQADTLRLLTWGGYAPDNVVELFEKETGHTVLVTKSNNEEMISKLRATGGGGFDLAQPSQDRITGPQQEFGIYKPIDLSRIDTSAFIPSMLEATRKNTTVDGVVYGVPHVWGTTGMVVNVEKAPNVREYTDLCNPDVAGRVTYRLKRPTLIAFAYSMGMDPFAAYGDEAAYKAIIDKVEAKLIECKGNVKAYWSSGDDLLGLMRSGEVWAGMGWDAGGWKLHRENPAIKFVVPMSGALGWIDTFALPKKGKADDAAYAWINFVMRPEIAAMITESAGNFTASKGSDEYVSDWLKESFQDSFPPEKLDNIKWYPSIPAGLEAIEGAALDRVKAAR